MARCVICGSEDCTHAPAIAHHDTYPFLPGGHPKVPGIVGRDFIYAPHAVYDRSPGVERCIYGAGDPVPMADAISLGLTEGPAAPKPEAEKTGNRRDRPRPKNKQAPADDRMKRGPGEAR